MSSAMDPANPNTDRELLDVLIRLMTPFRRQFQQSLDVNRFLVDATYAIDVVDRLLRADDPKILGVGEFLRSRLSGDARAQSLPASQVNPPASLATPATPTPLPASDIAPEPTPSQGGQSAKYVKRLR